MKLNVMRVLSLMALAMVLTACDSDGPAERAGENIDNAVESAGDKMEEAGDKIKDATN